MLTESLPELNQEILGLQSLLPKAQEYLRTRGAKETPEASLISAWDEFF